MGRFKEQRDSKLSLNFINSSFLDDLSLKFKSDPVNLIVKNTVNSVGSMFSSINAERVNQISHHFVHTLKKKTTKATNQGRSGRCWMFAGLNTFRHLLIHGLNLDNFEFSYVYLFFFDKLERANNYLKWFIDHPDEKPGSRHCDWILSDYMCDGGWWNHFANLISKYGIVPNGTMKETFQSDDSDEMNKIISDQLDFAVNEIIKKRNLIDLEKLRKENVEKIYNTLVKFLGEPPKEFNWQFSHHNEQDEQVSVVMKKLTPHTFLKLVAPKINVYNDFVCLAHIPVPQLNMNKKYGIKYTDNIEGGNIMTFFNVNMNVIWKSIIKSIRKGLAVWFAADVNKSFNWLHSSLDDQLDNRNLLFGNIENFDKGDRILLRNIQSCHAMVITGYNLDENKKPINWQVENSWGYFDDETPGLDGFLNMSHSWFEKYVTNVVIHKSFLPKNVRKMLRQKTIMIDPLEPYASALKVNGMKVPEKYIDVMKSRI